MTTRDTLPAWLVPCHTHSIPGLLFCHTLDLGLVFPIHTQHGLVSYLHSHFSLPYYTATAWLLDYSVTVTLTSHPLGLGWGHIIYIILALTITPAIHLDLDWVGFIFSWLWLSSDCLSLDCSDMTTTSITFIIWTDFVTLLLLWLLWLCPVLLLMFIWLRACSVTGCVFILYHNCMCDHKLPKQQLSELELHHIDEWW